MGPMSGAGRTGLPLLDGAGVRTLQRSRAPYSGTCWIVGQGGASDALPAVIAGVTPSLGRLLDLATLFSPGGCRKAAAGRTVRAAERVTPQGLCRIARVRRLAASGIERLQLVRRK